MYDVLQQAPRAGLGSIDFLLFWGKFSPQAPQLKRGSARDVEPQPNDRCHGLCCVLEGCFLCSSLQILFTFLVCFLLVIESGSKLGSQAEISYSLRGTIL